MKSKETRRDLMVEYIYEISGKRVDPLKLYNKEKYTLINLRAIAFRWFCIKHKIKLIDLMDLLDTTKYSETQSSEKLGISKKELRDSGKSV